MHEVERFALADGSYQHHLLRDEGRVQAYAAGVRMAVRAGDVVADLGSGAGLLSWVAVQAGARRVHAVEAHRGALAHLRRLVALHDVGGRVVPVDADAERWTPPEPVDVVVCELMEGGLLHEPIAAAMRNVHAWDHRPRAVVPRGAQLLVEGVEVPDTFEGYRAPLPGFRAQGSGTAMTGEVCVLDVDFEEGPVPEGVDARFTLRSTRPGIVHALRVRTVTQVAPGLHYETGPAYCHPVVLPLPEPLEVREAQELRGALRYTFAFDAEPLRFDVVP